MHLVHLAPTAPLQNLSLQRQAQRDEGVLSSPSVLNGSHELVSTHSGQKTPSLVLGFAWVLWLTIYRILTLSHCGVTDVNVFQNSGRLLQEQSCINTGPINYFQQHSPKCRGLGELLQGPGLSTRVEGTKISSGKLFGEGQESGSETNRLPQGRCGAGTQC